MYVGPWQDYQLLDRRRRAGEWVEPLVSFRRRVQDTIKGLDHEDAQRLLSLVNPLLADLTRRAREEDHAERLFKKATTKQGDDGQLPPLCPHLPPVKGAIPTRTSLDIFSKPFSKKLRSFAQATDQDVTSASMIWGESMELKESIKKSTFPRICPPTSRSSSHEGGGGHVPNNQVPLASVSAPCSVRRQQATETSDYDSLSAMKMLRLSERRALRQSSGSSEYFRQYWNWGGQVPTKRPAQPPPAAAADDRLQLVKRMKHVYSGTPTTWTASGPSTPVGPLQLPQSPDKTAPTPPQHVDLTEEHMSQVAKYFTMAHDLDPDPPHLKAPPVVVHLPSPRVIIMEGTTSTSTNTPTPDPGGGPDIGVIDQEETPIVGRSKTDDNKVCESSPLRVDDLIQWVNNLVLDDIT